MFFYKYHPDAAALTENVVCVHYDSHWMCRECEKKMVDKLRGEATIALC